MFEAFLSGDVPSNMKRLYTPSDIPKEERPDGKKTAFWIGYILNLLAKEGFTVEQQTTVPQSHIMSSGIIYLLSKPSPDSEKSEKAKKE